VFLYVESAEIALSQYSFSYRTRCPLRSGDHEESLSGAMEGAMDGKGDCEGARFRD
jgi:hypothetical protein